MTSRDDAARAAIADLRGELLVMPREEIVERHLNMMTFEQRVLATPRFVEKRAARAPMPTPRRAAVAFVCVISTLVSCGLSAAGALPEPLQNITESIAHTLGVPKTDHADAPRGHSAGAPVDKPVADATPKPTTNPSDHAVGGATTTTPTTAAATTTTTTPLNLPGPDTQIAKTPSHPPAQPIKPVETDPPPSKNSSNTPPGYPTDWRERATAAAAAQILQCAETAALAPAGCPQSAIPVGNAQVESAAWTLLNIPEDGAVVFAKTKPGNPKQHTGPTTTVTVFAAFQMSATYTEVGGAGPYLAYSGGLSVTTMTWNGSKFESVTFRAASASDVPAGVTAPTIAKPTNVDDGILLEALQSGFAACTVGPAIANDPIPTCPQPATAGATWTTVGNPLQGAVITYDPRTGLYTVTGSYAMTSSLAETASGPYTATLFFDNFRVRVLAISGA